MSEKTYIGDGVYVSDDGYQICLETQRENGSVDRIFMDTQVLDSFLQFVAKTFSATITAVKGKHKQVYGRPQGSDAFIPEGQ